MRNVLWMSGHDVRLHVDGCSGATTITYRESLPSEFAPLLVLDASGSLRQTYEFWEKGRGNLERVAFAGEDVLQPHYSPLEPRRREDCPSRH